MKISVSCAQLLPKLGDRAANLEKMSAYVEQIMAEKPGTNLIVFPELMTSGFTLSVCRPTTIHIFSN